MNVAPREQAKHCYVIGGPTRGAVERKVYPTLRAFDMTPMGAHTMDGGRRLNVPSGVDLIVFLTDCVSHALEAQLPQNIPCVKTVQAPDRIMAALADFGLHPRKEIRDMYGSTWRYGQAGADTVVKSPKGKVIRLPKTHRSEVEAAIRPPLALPKLAATIPPEPEPSQPEPDAEDGPTPDRDVAHRSILAVINHRGWPRSTRRIFVERVIGKMQEPWFDYSEGLLPVHCAQYDAFFADWPAHTAADGELHLNEPGWRAKAATFGVTVRAWDAGERSDGFIAAEPPLVHVAPVPQSAAKPQSPVAPPPAPSIQPESPMNAPTPKPQTGSTLSGLAALKERLNTPEVRLLLGRPLTDHDVWPVLNRLANQALNDLDGDSL